MTVMHDPIERNAVRAAIDDCLSGLENVPSRRADILTHVRGETQVKKKLSAGLVLAIVLTMLLAGAAVAAGLGLFDSLTVVDPDVRLPALETASTKVNATFVLPEGQTLTIDQAYYDGTRVFVSYRKTGNWRQTELGEGLPEGVVNWECEENVIFSKTFDMEGKEGQRLTKWLDGSAPRWARYQCLSVHDGMELSDGTYLEIIGGNTYEQEDGSIIGWKECIVPAEAAAEEITVCIGVFGSETMFYQTEDTLYEASLSNVETTWYPFTIRRNTDVRAMTGSVQGDGWSAVADLALNPIDLRGEVTVTCPTAWTDYWMTWEADGEIPDMLTSWELYVGDEPIGGYDLVGSTYGVQAGHMTYGICWHTKGATEGLRLVPQFLRSGSRTDLAIELTFAD